MEKEMTVSGSKAQQRGDSENRALPFTNWHRSLNAHLIATDVDLIEWRIRQGELVPVAVFELTRVDLGIQVNEKYLGSILERYNKRDLQGRTARYSARVHGVHAWIVLFREDVSELWVYNLTKDQGWYHRTPKAFEHFLESL